MRQSFTAVIERNITWQGDFAVEPYEVAWATEAIYFVRALDSDNMPAGVLARVQISPDGIRWCDEGTTFDLPTTSLPESVPDTSSDEASGTPSSALTFGKVNHFGGWLRLVGKLPDAAKLTVIVYLTLKE
jgi:hypothetical protein